MSYGVFASHYDILTENVNYGGYARRVDRIIRRIKPDSESVADIACGTASLGIELFRLGYNVVGADISEAMIDEGRRKVERLCGKSGPRLMARDMRALRLKCADAAVCSLDALNHLDGFEDLRLAFMSVRSCLNPGGVFIFDMNTPYKHRRVLGDGTFFYDRPGVCCVWRNEYLGGEFFEVRERLDFFAESGGTYRRESETVVEKAYRRGTVRRLLTACGFGMIEEYDGLRDVPPSYNTERILWVARRVV